MMSMSTFYGIVHTMCQTFCENCGQANQRRPGPLPLLDAPKVMTLGIIQQVGRFQSERAFWQYAQEHLVELVGALPHRTQYNRQLRRFTALLDRLAIEVAEMINARHVELQVIDTTPIPVRDYRRRGNGWMAGDADIGYATRLGWYQGFRLLVAVGAYGAITGYCFAPASTNDRRLADALFALRAHPHPRVTSVGLRATRNYIADKGFAGNKWQPGWLADYGACVIAQGQKENWPAPTRRWMAHYRQIVETVFACLHCEFRLDRDRPHSLPGLQVRLAAKVVLHNIVIALNSAIGRGPMATSQLLSWI
jgi:hypothetical protein